MQWTVASDAADASGPAENHLPGSALHSAKRIFGQAALPPVGKACGDMGRELFLAYQMKKMNHKPGLPTSLQAV